MKPKTDRSTNASFDLPQRQSTIMLLTVALIYALELFAFQALSFHFDYPVPLVKQIGAQGIRLLLDLLFCIGLVFLLPRLLTILSFCVFVLFTQIASYYQAVFDRVLSWTTMSRQFSEGLGGGDFDWSYVGWLLLILLCTLVVKIWLLLRVRFPLHFLQRRRIIGLAAILGYGALLGGSMWKIDRPDKLRSFVTADRFGMTYGYLPLWWSEAVYLNMDHLLQEAVAQRSLRTNRLQQIEAPIALMSNVVMLQVESLDWRLLNYHVAGQPVTPFLNRLVDDAMLFKITAFHKNGSGDTDFVMLNAVPPSPTLMTYKLKDYPYQETLPQWAAQAGYTSIAIHGNSGRFFARRHAFNQMGFTQTLFLEELRDDLEVATSLWGIRDDAVLEISQAMLRDEYSNTPQLHYIITLTSHQPFIYLEPEQHTFLPSGEGIQARYLNTMHFVDQQLASYVGGLPDGTLVFLFGDHRAMVEYDTATDTEAEHPEHVPLFIHRVGDRLAEHQASRDLPIAMSGTLTMVDAASYIHSLFKSKAATPEITQD